MVKGHNPGLYGTWFGVDGAADQVKGYSGAICKGFHAREEALEWLKQFSEETQLEFAPDLLDLIEKLPIAQEIVDAEEILQAGRVLIYTDGAAITNPGPGGYGVVLRYKEHKKELSGGFRLTTINRMELMTCIKGLQALKRKSDVVLYSDSRYVVNAIEKGWAVKWQANEWKRDEENAAKNSDVCEQLLSLCKEHDIEFRWVRGHTGNLDNERCDQLATEVLGGKICQLIWPMKTSKDKRIEINLCSKVSAAQPRVQVTRLRRDFYDWLRAKDVSG